MTSRSSKTFECITERIWDGTFERHFQRVVLINHLNGVSFWCCNEAFRLAHSEMYPCSIWFSWKQGQVLAWGQFRFVWTEPSSNSIWKSISGRFWVNSIRTWVENIDTKLDSPNLSKLSSKIVLRSGYFERVDILEKWVFWKMDFCKKWIFWKMNNFKQIFRQNGCSIAGKYLSVNCQKKKLTRKASKMLR